MSNFFLIVCLFFSIFSFSQENCSITYKGIVLDEHDNKPVPFAKIQIKGKNIGALADSLGYFTFSSLCEGVYNFSCLHHVGCEPFKFDKEFKKSISNYFDTIYIEFHFQELDETKIVHTVFEISSISVVKPNELEKKMALGKTLGELLKQIPGVSTLNTGNSISKPVIHGMHSNRIVSMNNEIRQEGQQWGSEHAPEIDPFLCTDVSLIKGANAIRFGSDAIAGVIQVSPEKLSITKGLRGKIQTTAFSNGKSGSISGILEGGCSKLTKKDDKHIFSWRIQGTAKQGGTMKTPNYFLKNTAMKEYNFSWNTVYTFKKWQSEFFYSQFNTDLGIFAGAHIGNLTDLQNAFQAKEPIEKGEFTYEINRPKQHIEHELFKVKNQYVFNDKHKINLIYGRQFNLRQEFDNHLSYDDSLAALNLPAFQFALTTHTLDLKYEHSFLKNTTGEIGLSSIYQKNTWQGRFFIPNFLKKSLGAYLLEVLKWKNNEL
ncbi:MAG: TonB-dependent receptor, partial [Bacteroidota bacterium]